MKLPIISKLAFSISALMLASQVIASVELPVVPLDVMKEGVPAPVALSTENSGKPKLTFRKTNHSEIRNSNQAGVETKKSIDLNYANDIEVESGQNYIIPISNGHVNRIVTPFENPNIATTNSANIEVRKNIIYVGSLSQSAITLFITEKGVEGDSIGLTLVPRKMPSREVRLTFKGYQGKSRSFASTQRAKKWEESQPYIDTLKKAFRGIALGQIPRGYVMDKTDPLQQLPSCQQDDLWFRFDGGQTITGHNIVMLIGLAKNNTTRPIEFKPESCGDWNVIAVSSFPHTVLEPGQKTEVYVAMKRYVEKPASLERPSLLDGGM